MYRFREALGADFSQVVRLRKAVQSYAEPFVNAFGPDVAKKVVVPCVLHSRTFGLKGNIEGVYFTDASAFMRFFRGPTMDVKRVGRSSDETADHDIPIIRIWKGDKPTPDELIQHLQNPIQRRHMAERLEFRNRFSILGDRCVALAPYVVRKDIVSGDVLAAFEGNTSAIQEGIDTVGDIIRGPRKREGGLPTGNEDGEGIDGPLP